MSWQTSWQATHNHTLLAGAFMALAARDGNHAPGRTREIGFEVVVGFLQVLLCAGCAFCANQLLLQRKTASARDC